MKYVNFVYIIARTYTQTWIQGIAVKYMRVGNIAASSKEHTAGVAAATISTFSAPHKLTQPLLGGGTAEGKIWEMGGMRRA